MTLNQAELGLELPSGHETVPDVDVVDDDTAKPRRDVALVAEFSAAGFFGAALIDRSTLGGRLLRCSFRSQYSWPQTSSVQP